MITALKLPLYVYLTNDLLVVPGTVISEKEGHGYNAINHLSGDFWMNSWVNNTCDIRSHSLYPVSYQLWAWVSFNYDHNPPFNPNQIVLIALTQSNVTTEVIRNHLHKSIIYIENTDKNAY